MQLKQEYVISSTDGKVEMILSRGDALKLRDLLNREFGTEVSVAATTTAPVWEDAPAVVPDKPEARQALPPESTVKAVARAAQNCAEPWTLLDMRKMLGRHHAAPSVSSAVQSHRKLGRIVVVKPGGRGKPGAYRWAQNASTQPPVEAHSTLLYEIIDLMGNEPWSIESLASYFNTDAATVKNAMMFPGTRFQQVEEGIMQLKPQYHIP